MGKTANRVVLQIPVWLADDHEPTRFVLTDDHQSIACAHPSLVVGLQGETSPAESMSLLCQEKRSGAYPVRALIKVNAAADPLTHRTSNDGLVGMPYFHAKYARRELGAMMGTLWRRAVERLAQSRGELFQESVGEVDWTDPISYMTAFPEATHEVFRLLPHLEVMVVWVRNESADRIDRVAVFPKGKIRLVDEAYLDMWNTPIAIRSVSGGQTFDVPLPSKKPPVRWYSHPPGTDPIRLAPG